jgi:hypothetical protein
MEEDVEVANMVDCQPSLYLVVAPCIACRHHLSRPLSPPSEAAVPMSKHNQKIISQVAHKHLPLNHCHYAKSERSPPRHASNNNPWLHLPEPTNLATIVEQGHHP